MTHPPDDELDDLRVFHPETDENLDEPRLLLEPKPTFDEVVAALRSGEYPRSILVGLSDLSVSDAATLKALWPQIGVTVKRGVASELHDLSEERLDYIFSRALLTLVDDPDAGVRQLAIKGIWEWDDPTYANTFINILKTDDSEDVRFAAARALGPFAEMAELEELDEETSRAVRDTLIDALSNESESLHVRARCLESAAVFGRDPAVIDAIEFFHAEDDTGFRATAIFAMGRSFNQQFLPTILNETASDDSELRFEAARAAGRMGDHAALPALAELGRDEDAEVRQAAINAMGEIGGKAAIRYLQRLGESANEAELELIAEAMEEATLLSDPLFLDDEA